MAAGAQSFGKMAKRKRTKLPHVVSRLEGSKLQKQKTKRTETQKKEKCNTPKARSHSLHRAIAQAQKNENRYLKNQQQAIKEGQQRINVRGAAPDRGSLLCWLCFKRRKLLVLRSWTTSVEQIGWWTTNVIVTALILF